MISFQEATKEADKFIKSLYGEVEGLLLEEIEYDESKTHWFITLSFVTKKV